MNKQKIGILIIGTGLIIATINYYFAIQPRYSLPPSSRVLDCTNLDYYLKTTKDKTKKYSYILRYAEVPGWTAQDITSNDYQDYDTAKIWYQVYCKNQADGVVTMSSDPGVIVTKSFGEIMNSEIIIFGFTVGLFVLSKLLPSHSPIHLNVEEKKDV